ncbi:hypothetical protein GQ44DRAFT_404136 [Phaeosphaeriaceae sp. PMI808]|nr:hypothetical protein GQ44DRAFT_404136 [Phaeosphaeriaceae sp. PMI808]
MEPLSLGAVFASIGSAFKFADLAIRVNEVGSENEVFVRTIRIVRDDLNEVERLLSVESVQRKLTSTPSKLPWVKSAILNTKSGLNEIGRWVERARSEQEATGDIRFETRVRWVFNDHEKLVNRKTELMTCHQQLSNVLSYLQRLEDVPTSLEPPDYIDTTFFDDILSRHRRQPVSKTEATNHNTMDMRHESSPLAIPHNALDSTNSSVSKTSIPPSINPCPDTPPPSSYTTVTHDTRCDDESYQNFATTSSLYDPHRKSWEHVSQHNLYHEYDGTTQSSDVRAYRMPYHDIFTPELAGDTVCMSGTNSLGPVNPFEFSNETANKNTSLEATQDQPKVVAELLGNLSFAVEMPADSPSPPPGYPPRPTQRKPINISIGQLETRRHNSDRSSGVELPAISRRRPALPHATTESTPRKPSTKRESIITRHTIAAPMTFKPLSSYSSEKILVSSSLGTHDETLELPSSSQPPPSIRHSYSPSSCQGNSSMSHTEFPGKFLPLRIPPPRPHMTSCEPEASKGIAGVVPTSHNIPTPPVEPASIARMRRQKYMMNLLGSIEF